MSNTNQLGLPLLQAAQAQKHVTVNEALAMLDALACLRVQSLAATTPPGVVTDGEAYVVGGGAVNAWSGKTGQIAIGANGGWMFSPPCRGMARLGRGRGPVCGF